MLDGAVLSLLPKQIPVKPVPSHCGLLDHRQAGGYSSRRDRSDDCATQAPGAPLNSYGFSTIPTPILYRARASRATSEPSPTKDQEAPSRNHNEACERKRCESNKRIPVLGRRRALSQDDLVVLKPLKKTVEPEIWDLYEGIYAVYKALLATTKAVPKSRKGCRSLFDTSLGLVPGYTKHEEVWDQAAADASHSKSSIDLSSAIYEDIEGLSSAPGAGFKPLMHIVRAHATSLLADATATGLLPALLSRSLISMCTSAGAHDEGEVLLSALIDSANMPQPSTAESRLFTSVALSALDTFVKETHRRGFFYRQLASLFGSGRLSPRWLATADGSDTWTKAMQTVTERSKDRTSALQFIQIALESACQVPPADSPGGCESFPKHALDMTVGSIVATIVSFLIVRQESQSLSPSEQNCALAGILQALSIDIFAYALHAAQANKRTASYIPNRSNMVLFAQFLQSELTKSSEDRHGPVESTGVDCDGLATLLRVTDALEREKVASMDGRGAASEMRGLLTCSIARSWGKASSEDGFRHLRMVVDWMLQLLHQGSTPPKLTDQQQREWGKLILSTVSAFADYSGDQSYPGWAQEMAQEGIILDLGLEPSRTPRTNGGDSSQYRWEDGLCEWVMATPAVAWKASNEVDLPATMIEHASDSDEARSSPLRCSSSPELPTKPVSASSRPCRWGPQDESTPKLSKLLFGQSSSPQKAFSPPKRPAPKGNPSVTAGAFDTEQPASKRRRMTSGRPRGLDFGQCRRIARTTCDLRLPVVRSARDESERSAPESKIPPLRSRPRRHVAEKSGFSCVQGHHVEAAFSVSIPPRRSDPTQSPSSRSGGPIPIYSPGQVTGKENNSRISRKRRKQDDGDDDHEHCRREIRGRKKDYGVLRDRTNVSSGEGRQLRSRTVPEKAMIASKG
ncbi:MAG: hypothetical protein M1817_004820 [Caeruleum heppii]|nr:MAG: hypothetical protein M1817_004820 [Caeruleum heppii]